jgi:UPF0755 protein
VQVLRKIFLLLVYVGIPAAILFATYSKLTHFVFDARDPQSTEVIVFDAELATSFQEIANNLERQGLIRNGFAFRTLARLQKKDTQIKAGEYELSASMKPQEILDKMVRGEMLQRRATIKEGMTLLDIGRALQDAGIIDAQSFYLAATDTDFAAAQGVKASSFEGYLFPDTYNFRRKTPARKIVATMLEQLQKRWPPEWAQRATILEMTLHQVLTLASIIEKESGNFEEQPVISSVFHNRLRKGMRLQADPTVIYGIKNFDGNITRRDLMTHTPYNTYMIDGLPPGPIANPGVNAIKAALYPADTNFLYFVGDGQGKHVFSETLYQHNNAVNQYQRGASRPQEELQRESVREQLVGGAEATSAEVNEANAAPPQG